MNRNLPATPESWEKHAREWRDPAQICSQWKDASAVDDRLLEVRASPNWWDLLAERGITLLITREYEHLVIAAGLRQGRPRLSYFPIPHPSGLAVDRKRNSVYLASTRNPNQIYTLKAVEGLLERGDSRNRPLKGKPLVPSESLFFPGCMYIHDLALIGSKLHANAVGHNAIARIEGPGNFTRVWWPKCVERRGLPVFSCNHIQLNSIAAGPTVASSYFSASSSRIGRLRPGHLRYKVDRQGVIFSGRTREPICEGLTRPHSARLRGDEIWVANSGYGELGFVSRSKFEPVVRVPGWTRGLCIMGDLAFVATSRVIPRYARYAPGLDPAKSVCGVFAVSLRSGEVLASLSWKNGNQVFAIEWLPADVSDGFVFEARRPTSRRELDLFYSFRTVR